MRRKLLIGFLIAFPAAVSAQDAQRGLEAYRAGDYATAYAQWRPLAQSGNPTWQFNLGTLYLYGQGVAQDQEKALEWFEAAAKNGLLRAQITLAEHYENHPRGERDTAIPHAIKWRTLAAEAGDGISMVKLAEHLDIGYLIGTDHYFDRDGAMHWYDMALVALQREVLEDANLRSLSRLADLYDRAPMHLQPDRARAIALYEVLLAETGDRAVMHALGNIYRRSDDPEFFDLSMAYEWYRRAALAGLGVSQGEIASAYARGAGVTQNTQMALLWYVISQKNNGALGLRALDDILAEMPAHDRTKLEARAETCIAQNYVDCGL